MNGFFKGAFDGALDGIEVWISIGLVFFIVCGIIAFASENFIVIIAILITVGSIYYIIKSAKKGICNDKIWWSKVIVSILSFILITFVIVSLIIYYSNILKKDLSSDYIENLKKYINEDISEATISIIPLVSLDAVCIYNVYSECINNKMRKKENMKEKRR